MNSIFTYVIERALRAFAIFACLFSLQTASAEAPKAASAESAGREGLRQIAGILDYIGGDYRGAVGPDGQILNQAEYDEQLSLVKDGDALAVQAGLAASEPVRVALAALSRALNARAAPDTIQSLCRQAREVLVRTQQLSLVPSRTPSRDEAAKLYFSHACNTCHGDDGSARTQAAAALDPRPANFLDPERVATVSPHRAFHAITFGVPGTAMLAYSALNDAQRWSLAFYVLSLRHLQSDLGLGRRAFEGGRRPAPNDLGTLSSSTEEELSMQLRSLPDPKQREAALAYLRAEAPFARPTDTGLALSAIPMLDRGIDAYRRGDSAQARKLFISAYLDGFEPHEASLRAKNAELVNEIERVMMQLRVAASEGKPPAEVALLAERARVLMLRAQDTGSSPTTAFLGALGIALREGLEIVLLIGALLGLVRKRGYPELAKHVHAGWLLALPAGFVTYLAASSILGGMERELAEGVASLLAAVVLLGVTHWMIGQVTARKWVGFLARQVTEAASSRRAAVFVLLLAFVAAYREAFEIVLFYQALLLDAAEHVRHVWIGTAVGLLVLSAIALVLRTIGEKLKPAPFMLASSIFLAMLSFMLVGKGVRALQEAAVLDVHPLGLPEIQWLGVYATREGLLAQGLLLVLLLGSAIWPWWSGRLQATPAAAE